VSDLTPVVFLVDDEPAVLKAITRLLGAAGYRTAAFNSPQLFLEQYDGAARGCLLLDISMPGLNGMKLQQALIEKNCALPIIFLTGHGDIPTSVEAMKHGAVDFLTKPVNDAALIAAVQHAFEQEAAGRALHTKLDGLRQRLANLTPREHEVLGHVIAGRLNKQIADLLGTTEKTIKVHRARVMEKMQAQSLADLVRIAGTAGIPPTIKPVLPAVAKRRWIPK
jgi:FixJ family two-component response regulator